MEITTAEILIGGPIPESLVPGLMEALSKDEASHEYGDSIVPDMGHVSDSKNACKILMEYRVDGVLRFRCVAAPWGEFDQTEPFCMQHGIAFNRKHDAIGEWGGEEAIFRPGMEVPEVIYLDIEGRETARGDEVRKAIVMLEKEDGEFRGEYRVKKALELLYSSLNCMILPPTMEPVTIVS